MSILSTYKGFEHTLFAFGVESNATQAPLDWSHQVKPHALISALQKARKFLEVEAHVDEVFSNKLDCFL